MPRTAVNEEAFGLGLFLEPTENFVFFDGQVVAVVHDVVIEVFLVMECPTGEGQGDNQHDEECGLAVIGGAVAWSCKVLDKVGDRQCGHKSHRREHHQAITLVDFDGEVAGDVFQDHESLDVVQQQEGEYLEVEEVLLLGIYDRAIDEIDGADCKQVVEVAEERVHEGAVLVELHGHHFPVLGEVFKEMTVSFELSALETEPLEIADREECRDREEGKEDEKYGSLGVLLVDDAWECKEDKCKNAEDRFLAGLGKEGEGQGEESPVLYRVPVVGPLEEEERKS